MKLTTGLVVFALTAVSIPAAAQSADPVPTRMTGMFTVYVMDKSGGEEEGKLVGLTGSAVVLEQKGSMTSTLNLAEVTRIYRKGDSLKNGALIGAGAGLFFGALAGGLSDCPRGHARAGCAGTRVVGVLSVTGVYAAIGTAIDALIPGRTLLWRAGK